MSFWGIVIGLIILVITYACSIYTFDFEEGCGVVVAIWIVSALFGILVLLCPRDVFVKYLGIISLMNAGALVVAFLISWLIDGITWYDMDEVYHNVYGIIYLACILITFLVMNNQANGIVQIEEPVIITNRYELLASDEFTSGEDEYSKLIYSPGSGYYEFFYQTKDESGEIVIETYTVKADDVKVTIQSGMEEPDCDYLLEVVTTYYEEDRNKEPYERNVTSENVERKLYLRESTFENMIIVGEGK